MTSTEDHSDDVALAGEYALHLLETQERRDFEARLLVEPRLRNILHDWESQFAQLTNDIAPVTAPPQIKAQIEARLFAPAAAPKRGLWQWFAGAAVAAGLAVAAFQLTVTPPPIEPSFVAEVAAEDQSLVVVASFVPENRTLQINRLVGAAFEGRVLELWLIAEGATAPVSLGVLPDDTVALVEVSRDIAGAMIGGTLAISDEPPGGSPTGAPTGAVLAAAPIQAL